MNLKNVPISFINRMIYHRQEMFNEMRAWEIYKIQYEHMDKSNFKQYSFKKRRKIKVSRRSAAELLARAERINAKFAKAKEDRKNQLAKT